MNNISHISSTVENSLENDLYALSKLNDTLRRSKIALFRSNQSKRRVARSMAVEESPEVAATQRY